MLMFLPSRKSPPLSEYWEDTLVQGATKIALLGNTIQVDSSSNIYCGLSGTDHNIGKFSATGVLAWVRSITGTSSASISVMRVDNSAIYVLATSATGSTVNNSGVQAANLLKYDHSGNLIWKFVYGTGSIATNSSDIAITSDGHVYLACQTPSGGTPLILKINSTTGDLVWQRRIGANTLDAPSIAVDTSNNCYVTFTANLGSQETSRPVALVKISSAGAFMWGIRINKSSDPVRSQQVSVTPSGDVLLSYWTTQAQAYVPGTNVHKFTSAGVPLWDRNMNHSTTGNQRSVQGKFVVDSLNIAHFMLLLSPAMGLDSSTVSGMVGLSPEGALTYNRRIETPETLRGQGFSSSNLALVSPTEIVLPGNYLSVVTANSAQVLMRMRTDVRMKNIPNTRYSGGAGIFYFNTTTSTTSIAYTVGVYEGTPTVAKGASPLVDALQSLASFTVTKGSLITY